MQTCKHFTCAWLPAETHHPPSRQERFQGYICENSLKLKSVSRNSTQLGDTISSAVCSRGCCDRVDVAAAVMWTWLLFSRRSLCGVTDWAPAHVPAAQRPSHLFAAGHCLMWPCIAAPLVSAAGRGDHCGRQLPHGGWMGGRAACILRVLP